MAVSAPMKAPIFFAIVLTTSLFTEVTKDKVVAARMEADKELPKKVSH